MPMHELRLPLDYERLPEFWQLTDALRASARDPKPHARAIEQSAAWLWLRLWVSLGYLAQSTNRPGYLAADGLRRLTESMEPVFSDADLVRDLLTRGSTPLLRKVEGAAPPHPALSPGGGEGTEEYFCALFARSNEHLAGNHLPAHKRGNIRSRLSAAKNLIAADADAQAMLLPPEIFRLRDGRPMAPATVQRAMVVIMTLDRCLKAPPRPQHSYTEGLLADAGEVVLRDLGEALQQFYYWVAENKDHPRVPKATEEILRDFDRLLESSR